MAILLFIDGCTGIKDAHTGEAGEVKGAEEQNSSIEEPEYESYLLQCREEKYRPYFGALIASADRELDGNADQCSCTRGPLEAVRGREEWRN